MKQYKTNNADYMRFKNGKICVLLFAVFKNALLFYTKLNLNPVTFDDLFSS